MKLTSQTLRVFTTVHTWTGLITGMALFIAFYAGAVTMFHGELQLWAKPELRDISGADLGQVQALVDDVVLSHPEAAGSFRVRLSGPYGPQTSASWWADGESWEQVAPGSPALDHDGGADSELADLVNELHFTLGLPYGVGLYLMGLVSVLYGLALISGVIIHLPKLVKDLMALRAGRNLKRFWQDAHNVIGVMSLPFHAMFAFTGVFLTISVLFFAAYNVLVLDNRLNDFIGPMTAIEPPREMANEAAPMLPVREILRRAEAAVPGLEPGLLSFTRYGDASALVTVRGPRPGTLIDETHVTLSATSGELIAVQQSGERKPYWSAVGGIVALHFGTFGGVVVQWLYFLLGLAGAFLFYSGNLLWLESRRRRRQAEQAGVHRFLARLTVGVCVGCMLAISAVFLAVHLLPDTAQPQPAWEWRVYYAVFFAAVCWAMLRAPAQAAVELLWLSAAATVLVPCVNAVLTGDHPLRAMLDGHWAVAILDLTALAMAAAFAAMARATARRAQHGDPNSVWAHPRVAAAAASAR